MTIYIFSGPTINETDARHYLDAVYLPPVSQGDIISLLPRKPAVIGLIDGYFDRVPAVWHKEILLALSQGVAVVGGASMGALRAAELHSFGMTGIGEIFEWFRDGRIEADDEVAVQHAPAEYGYRPFNEALVNIRKTLDTAVEAAVISSETAGKLVEIGRRTLYWDRTYGNLLKEGRAAGLPEAEIEALGRFVETNAVDLKRQDAVKLLDYIARMPENGRQLPSFELNETVFLARLIDQDRRLTPFDDLPLTTDDLVNFLRFERAGYEALNERAGYEALNERAMLNSLILDLGRRLGLAVDEEDVRRETTAFQAAHDLSGEVALEGWQARNHLAPDEFRTFMEELALIRKVRGIYLGRNPKRAVIRQLHLENGYEAAFEGTRRKAAVLGEHSAPPDVSLSELIAAYFAEIGRAVPEDMDAYAAGLGFHDYQAFILELEKSDRFRRHNDKIP